MGKVLISFMEKRTDINITGLLHNNLSKLETDD
jgi:hypothetical protein